MDANCANKVGAQHDAWKSEERGEEVRSVHVDKTREQVQLSAIRPQPEQEGTGSVSPSAERDFEGGFGGQEDLEDRYATTSGEH